MLLLKLLQVRAAPTPTIQLLCFLPTQKRDPNNTPNMRKMKDRSNRDDCCVRNRTMVQLHPPSWLYASGECVIVRVLVCVCAECECASKQMQRA